MHYGDTTLTFLNNWYRADARGTALTYVSAVAVEEKSLLDYNRGNPDGVLDPGEVAPPAQGAARGDLPEGGHALLRQPADHPRRPVGERPSSSRRPSCSATTCCSPRTSSGCWSSASAPATPRWPSARRSSPANGVDPAQPQAVLEVPEAGGAGRGARQVGRAAQGGAGAAGDRRVGLDGRARRARGPSTTKLDLAKQAAIASLDQFKDEDEVGLRIFTTDITGEAGVNYLDLLPVAPIGRPASRAGRSASATSSRSTAPRSTTSRRPRPTPCATTYDPDKINAVVLLTDGRNEDGEPGDDEAQLEALLTSLRGSSEGVNSRARADLPHRLRRGRRPGRAAPHRRGVATPSPTTPATPRRSTRSSPRWCRTSDGARGGTGCSRARSATP